MNSLTLPSNPVEKTYRGNDAINVQQLQAFAYDTNSNMAAIETAINRMEGQIVDLSRKLRASYEFIDWMREIHPELMQEYRAHNQVAHAFDRAERAEFVYPHAEGAA
jgi:hypothetical protein